MPRNYSTSTIKRLFGLSGNQCSFPECPVELVNKKNALDSNICHIEAAKEGGERYRANMSNKERADYPNLILLCRQHHAETNDTNKYTVNVLQKMKQNHEDQQRNKSLTKNPSMLRHAIDAITNLGLNEEDKIINEDLNAFNINEKIKHNAVKRNATLIQDYKAYHNKLNLLYGELENQGSLKKTRILSIINGYYLKAKGPYVTDSRTPLDNIREHADDIIDDVINALYSKLDESGLFEEDIIFGVDLIVVDAFMRCKILEEPSGK